MSGYRAPVGGCVSRVNGEFYNGGEFMPDHGLFCGKAGAKRKQVWDKYGDDRKVNCGGQSLFVVVLVELSGIGDRRSCNIGAALADSREQAVAAFMAHTGWYLRPNERINAGEK